MKTRLEPILPVAQTMRAEVVETPEGKSATHELGAPIRLSALAARQEALPSEETIKKAARKRRFLRRVVRVAAQGAKVGLPLCALGLWGVGAHNMMTALFFVFISFCALLYFIASAAQTAIRLHGGRGAARPRGARRRLVGRLAAQAGLFALVQVALFTALRTSWPLRITFAASQPALERLAARVEKGEAVRFPVRAGALKIYAVRQWGPNIYVYKTEPGGAAGLLHGAKGTEIPLGMGDVDAPLAPHWVVWSDD